jgi:hypothetical protein
VFRSTDGGDTWFSINNGLPDLSQHITAIGVDPFDGLTVYAGDADGNVWKTTDFGANWVATGSLPIGTNVTSIAIDRTTGPFSTVYVGTNAGVAVSADGGGTWTAFNSGLTSTAVTSLAIDDIGTGILYAGTGGGGVFLSDVGGGATAWTAINNGLSGLGLQIRTIAFEPLTTTVYVGTRGAGVFRTANASDIANNAWTAINAGLGVHLDILSLAVASSTTIYAGTGTASVMRTTNGGALWSSVNSGATSAPAASKLFIDPNDVQTIFLGISGRGLFKTLDALATPWQPTGDTVGAP